MWTFGIRSFQLLYEFEDFHNEKLGVKSFTLSMPRPLLLFHTLYKRDPEVQGDMSVMWTRKGHSASYTSRDARLSIF